MPAFAPSSEKDMMIGAGQNVGRLIKLTEDLREFAALPIKEQNELFSLGLGITPSVEDWLAIHEIILGLVRRVS